MLCLVVQDFVHPQQDHGPCSNWSGAGLGQAEASPNGQEVNGPAARGDVAGARDAFYRILAARQAIGTWRTWHGIREASISPSQDGWNKGCGPRGISWES